MKKLKIMRERLDQVVMQLWKVIGGPQMIESENKWRSEATHQSRLHSGH